MEKEKNKYNDYELIYMIRQNDDNAYSLLLSKYERLVFKLALGFCKNNKLDTRFKEELVQLGFIGLYEATTLFKESCNTTFMTFAYLVIKRKMQNYYTKYYKISAYEMPYEEEIYVKETAESYLPNYNSETPETIFFDKLQSEMILEAFDMLRPQDKVIIKYKLQGYSYKEIARFCNISTKQVDNALQRIKKELVKYL